MNANSASRKLLSLVLLIAGAASLVVSLVLDFSGSGASYRGALLIIGILALIVGLYLFPTLKNHRKIIYIIFLFPLLFTLVFSIPSQTGRAYNLRNMWVSETIRRCLRIRSLSGQFS